MVDHRRRRIEEIFHAALERAPQSRQAFLDTECDGDYDLRRQIELLLAKAPEAGSFLETPAVSYSAVTETVSGNPLGRQLGPYQVVSLLGAGGMGEVYRAHDSKLDRDIAIKILPPAFAQDSGRLARFRHEARTLASLNHPNIAAIYGLEEFDGLECLVLELVEGDNLRGPLPLNRALDYARQVSEGLEAAHENGIIHRDLKPANVKVTPEGRVKVLDFGLAKAISGPEGIRDLAQTAALTDQTATGHVLGTPGYMSPEQTRGESVDERADIWAFGCLLYELLTGKRAFHGESYQDTVNAVLERDPDWQALPARTPASIRNLLRQCLQKEPSRRLSSIADARTAIEKVHRRGNRWLAAATVAVVLAGLAVGTALWFRRPERVPDRSEWVQLTKFPDPVSQPALSPDGRLLTFVRGPRTTYGLGQIYVKALPDGEPVQLTHDNLRKSGPAFSPDGSQIAYTVTDPQFNWETWLVPVAGGDPHPWLRNASGLSWSGRRQLLFSEIKVHYPMGIVTARDDRTIARDVYFPRNARGMASRSEASPDGKWALVAEMAASGDWDRCRVVPMDGGSPGKQVGPPGAPCSFVAWSRDGKWTYLTSKAGGLFHTWRQRFPDGQPQQYTFGPTEEEGVAMAPDGRSLITAVALESSTLWIHDARGERQISVLEGNAAYPKFSTDGKKLYYRVVKAVPIVGTKRDPGEVWVADVESGHSERVAPGFEPLEYDISRDGRQIAMQITDAEGKPRLWVAPVDRSSAPRMIAGVEGLSPLFGPGGEIFFRHVEGPSSFVYRVRPDGAGLRKAFEQPAFYAGEISPDGRWIRTWAPAPDNLNSISQLVPLDGGRSVVVGSNMRTQWSASGDSVWLSAGAVPDGRTYIVPLHGVQLPAIPEGGFHSEREVAALPGARRLDVEGAPGPSLGTYAFERQTIQRNLFRVPIR